MSKSLFFLLLMVTLLTAGASLQSGGLRLESGNAGNEFHADIRSLQTDAKALLHRMADTPTTLHSVWVDFIADWKDLKADASAEAHDVARKLGSFVGTKSGPVS